jgi:hypothetical protein
MNRRHDADDVHDCSCFSLQTAAAAPLVTFESPCECREYHRKGRLTQKNDAALPPTDPNAIQAVTPSDIFIWQGPSETLTQSSGRIAAEQKWYALTAVSLRYARKLTIGTFMLIGFAPPKFVAFSFIVPNLSLKYFA